MPKDRDSNSIFYVGVPISYRDAIKSFNRQVFDDKLWVMPKKGSAGYNDIQLLRSGQSIPTKTMISDLTKPEDAKVLKKKPEVTKAPEPKKRRVLKTKKVESKPVSKVESFGSTIIEQVENIKKILNDMNAPLDKKKQAVRKALEILKYKENNIIQEARKPLQRELFLELQAIKRKPKFTQYYLPSPTGGNTGSRLIDRTDLAEEIPVFEKSVVEVVEEEVKKEEKARKKQEKEDQEKRDLEMKEIQEKEKENENASKVDTEALKDKWGTGMDKKYPSNNLFFTMAERGITDALDYNRNKGDLPDYKDFFATFGKTFFSKYDDYLQEQYEGDKKLRKLREEQDADAVLDKDGKLLYTKTALAKLEDEIKEAEKKAKDYLKEKMEIESTKGTKLLQKWGGAFTKKEAEEAEELNKMIQGKRILASDPIGKEYTKKSKELEMRALKGVQERSEKLRKLRRDLDNLVEKKLLMTGVIKKEDNNSGMPIDITDFMNDFARKGSVPKEEVKKMTENVSKAVDINPDEDWRAKAGYKDTVWNGSYATDSFNRNSQLPKEYTKEEGYAWLSSKYGDLYKKAIEKTKLIIDKRTSMTDKEQKEARRLEFKDGNQMKEFFRDVLLADPIVYQMININAFKTKAPATTNGLREFKKWVGK